MVAANAGKLYNKTPGYKKIPPLFSKILRPNFFSETCTGRLAIKISGAAKEKDRREKFGYGCLLVMVAKIVLSTNQ